MHCEVSLQIYKLALAVVSIPAILWFRSVPTEPTQAAVYDVIIANGTIVDGSGMPGLQGDLGIRGDRVIAVGDLSGAETRQRIDAKGMVVAPGFIDMMGQSELSVLIDPRAQSKIFQGITTEVTGEGGSAAPISDYQIHEQRDFLKHYKLKIDWQTLDGYFKRLEQNPPAINLATFVGTAQVRQYVMKDANRAPTPAELARMCALVKEAMEQGALGVTSALMYPPNSYAKTEELIALSKVASRYGGIYATHMRNEGDTIRESLDEAMRIGREANIPVEVFHLKCAGKKNWGQMPGVLKKLEAARSSGLDITADQYPYTAASNGLASCMPEWAAEGGLEKSLARLRNPRIREQIKKEIRHPKPGVDDDYLSAGGGSGILISSVLNPRLKMYEGKRLNEVAKMMGKKDELDAALDLILGDRGNTQQILFIMSEPDVRAAMKLTWIGVCCDSDAHAVDGPMSEGKPHPRCFGSFPRILGHYVRDLKLLTLEQAIYKMTSRSAERVHLKDRGLLKPGYFADVVVFDPRKVRDVATYENPKQISVGIRYVIVNGKTVITDGKQTAARPGTPLRGPGYSRK
jgi:N-acyl-D-amino-acid deacylase